MAERKDSIPFIPILVDCWLYLHAVVLFNGHVDVLSHRRIAVFLDNEGARTTNMNLPHIFRAEVLLEPEKSGFDLIMVESWVRELEHVALSAAPVLDLHMRIGLGEAGVGTVVLQLEADFEQFHACPSGLATVIGIVVI